MFSRRTHVVVQSFSQPGECLDTCREERHTKKRTVGEMHCEADAFYNEIILSPYIFSVNTVTEEWKRVPNRLLHMLFSMAGLV